jgi:carboxyl-terminal processing protease
MFLQRCLAAVAVAILAGCSLLPTRPAGGMVADLPEDTAPILQDGLSPEFGTAAQRLEVQQQTWQVIADRYYDPGLNGVDWAAVRDKYRPQVAAARSDAEFYLALKSMARELKDSHLRVVTPRESVDHRRFAARSTGIALTVIDDRLVVFDVDAESPAARAGVLRGDIVLAIDDHRFESDFLRAARDLPLTGADISSPEAQPALADEAMRFAQLRAVRRVLQRAPDAPPRPQKLLLQRDTGLVAVSVMAEPLVRPPAVTAHRLDSGVAVIKLNRFSVRNRREVESALQQVQTARALIIDLRGNGGGDYNQFVWLVGQFLAEPRVALTQLRRSGEEQRESPVRIAPGGTPYLKPIAVLTDRRSGSASELTATALLEQRDALIVGESTCGCVVGVSYEYVLPGGGGVRVSDTGFRSAQGRRMEGEPLTPTIYLRPTIADLRAGNDRVLQAAEKALIERSMSQSNRGSRPLGAGSPKMNQFLQIAGG